MIEDDGLKFDENTGEIFSQDNDIGPGGLYTPLGIPAYKVLATAKEFTANNVLTCLLSHRHKGSNEVWPSIDTIRQMTGHGKETVIRATKVLVEFGFITKRSIFNGKTMNNHYFIQDACFYSALLNERARVYLAPDRSCLACAKELRPGEYKNYGNKMAHWGCSGNITNIRAKRNRANGERMDNWEQGPSA